MTKSLIPNSCPEKWETMTPAGQNRFCGKCSRIIIDFTQKTTEEILSFISGKDDVCGRARVSQLQPIAVPVQGKKRLRIFSAAIYLVFGAFLFASCGPEEERVGKVSADSVGEVQTDQLRVQDSLDALNPVTKPQSDSMPLSEEEMRNTLKVLDSIAANK